MSLPHPADTQHLDITINNSNIIRIGDDNDVLTVGTGDGSNNGDLTARHSAVTASKKLATGGGARFAGDGTASGSGEDNKVHVRMDGRDNKRAGQKRKPSIIHGGWGKRKVVDVVSAFLGVP